MPDFDFDAARVSENFLAATDTNETTILQRANQTKPNHAR